MMNPRRGSLLVITLWLVLILSVLAVAIARYLSIEVRLTRYRLAREQAKVLARSGVYLAMQQLEIDMAVDPATQQLEQVDWLEDNWGYFPSNDRAADHYLWVVPLAKPETSRVSYTGHIEVRVVDEERRLDLNAVSNSAIVATLLQDVPPEVAQDILSDRNPPTTTTHSVDQGDATVPYYAKGTAWKVLEELWEIPQVKEHPELMTTLQAHGTLYTDNKINANTASLEVLRAVKGTPPPITDEMSATIDAFVRGRHGGEGQLLGNGQDCLFAGSGSEDELEVCLQLTTGLFQVPQMVQGLEHQSNVFRVVADGVIDRPAVRYHVEAIVKRTTNTMKPIEILVWRELVK